MEDKCRVAVIILNWNGRKFLEQFLPAVCSFSENTAEVYVADNASTDDSIAYLKDNFPAVKIIINPQNGGFAYGYNASLGKINAEYYILLNSDVEVTRGWIEPIIKLMDSDNAIGAVQPKIKSFTNPGYFEYAGAAGGFIDIYGYPFCRGRIFDTIEKDEKQYDKESEIFWATGACLFIRSALYHELGGFDEDLFSHQEEIDLCWRMKLLGHKVMYCPSSEVMHYGGGMLPKSNPFKTYLNFRNNLIILCKNHPSRTLLWKIYVRMILDGIACWRYFFMGNSKDAIAIIKGHLDFYRSLPKTLKKRKALKSRNLKPATFIYKRSIVKKYFIQRKVYFSQLNSSDFS
ncbi:MAG TPA: glycosyltransferase family 2 protein [Bacteroidia bacterium]|nr:glycosyltransferase family 2 protein [Bacteroidia bacterium]